MSAAPMLPNTGSDPTAWINANDWLPSDLRCVLATDGEAHFIACYDADSGWQDAYTEEPIDSVIQLWMELPEIPEV